MLFRKQKGPLSPGQLLGTILTGIKTLPKGYGRTSFMDGRRAMEKLTEELVGLAERKLGRRRAKKLRRYISFFRNFAGTREYPKYFWVCRYDIYKQALRRTAEYLAARGELREPGDLYYLYLEELQSLLRTGKDLLRRWGGGARLIHDGDRIRLDGEMGFVQILLN